MSTPPATGNQQGSESFREHLPTADDRGRRIWVYPKKTTGRLHTARTLLSYVLLAIMFAGPFIRIGGNPLLLFNVVERKFSILGQVFWPTDTFIFAVCTILFFIMIALFTAVFGRIWCGWLCPQTVLMEMVFRKIEYLIDGDANEQRELAAAPWNGVKIFKRALKIGVFFAISFIIGNWLLMYIIGSDEWKTLVTDDPAKHAGGLTAMLLFSTVFFLIFARFREQVCTFVCPYGRFQSVLLDEHSIVVAYDYKRGEKRGRFLRSVPLEKRRADGIGDCIECGSCVRACPTGIDIRNGLQMECVHCTACIDACNGVMDKVGLPRGLIRYASQNGIAKGEKLRVTPRIVIYCIVLTLLGSLLGYLLMGRSQVDATMLRKPGELYQKLADNWLNNVYLVKIRNRTEKEQPVSMKLIEPANGRITLAGATVVPPRDMIQGAVIVELPMSELNEGQRTIVIGLYNGDKLVQRLKSNFIGPVFVPGVTP